MTMSTPVPVRQLSEPNFSNWKFRVNTILKKEEVCDVLDVKSEDLKFREAELQGHLVERENLLHELESLGSKLDCNDRACFLLLTMLEE
ncbi:hypothetical protein PR048_007713 [Dryococelus australis]|uniref:Uncharacterized protein n=1 Tax=Dryococelus australis TaxID=614101 RepID=A0ABQ9HV11_9NEOP|nr:hypothetical protein PR048_007713 [Dryococelus australis]